MKRLYVLRLLLTSFIISSLITLWAFNFRNISPDPTPPLKLIDIVHFSILFGIALAVLFAPMLFCYWLIVIITKYIENKKG